MLTELIAKAMKDAVKKVGRSTVRGSTQFKHRPTKLKQYDLQKFRKVKCPGGGHMVVRTGTYHGWLEQARLQALVQDTAPTGVFKELRDRRKRRDRRVRAAKRAKEQTA